MLGRAGERAEGLEEPATVPADDFAGAGAGPDLDAQNEDDLPF